MEYKRSELREIIMTALYQMSLYDKNKMDYKVDEVIKELLLIDNEFVKDTVKGVMDNVEAIDAKADEYMTDWNIDRLGKTDQAILRLGIYELLYTETPDIVCINEAVELAKKFSDEKVSKLINGVLDKIYVNK